MLDKILTLQFGGFYGGGFSELLAYMEQAGFFAYVLPFLLIFALVFGILTRTQIFKGNKAINAVIALVVGLLALQFDFVPLFFSEIFPRLGIGLAIILALLILAGLFFDPRSKFINYGLLIVGLIVFIIVLVKTFGWLGWGWGTFSLWYYNWPLIISVIAGIVILAIIINSVSPRRRFRLPQLTGYWAQPGQPVVQQEE